MKIRKHCNYFRRFDGKTPRFTNFFTTKVIKEYTNPKTGISVVSVKVELNLYCPSDIFTPKERKEFSSKTFTGVTKLKGDDTYNKLIGLDIANHKAMKKAYKYMANCFEAAHLRFFQYAESCKELYSTAMYKYLLQNSHIHKKGEL